jgi:Zn-dependent protease
MTAVLPRVLRTRARLTVNRPYQAITVGRVRAIEITLNWRWLPVLLLASWLLAQTVLPARFPRWEVSTNWLTSVAAVLAGELALLLHELSHALLARGRGQEVTRIVFHGLRAETVIAQGVPLPAQEVLIALVGPCVNIALALLAQAVRLAGNAQGPVDVFLLTLVLGNLATALMSLVPISGSDGARALGALRRTRMSWQHQLQAKLRLPVRAMIRMISTIRPSGDQP